MIRLSTLTNARVTVAAIVLWLSKEALLLDAFCCLPAHFQQTQRWLY